MHWIEWGLMLLCLGVCITCGITDLKTERIRNQIVLPAALVSFAVNLGFSEYQHVWSMYLLNVLLVVLFSTALYALHFMGAGDSKLLTCIAAALPVRLYADRMSGMFGIVLLLICIFSTCMVYIAVESIFLLFKEKPNLRETLSASWGSFWSAYLRGMMVITFTNECLFLFCRDFYLENQYAVILLNFLLAALISEHRVFRSELLVWLLLSCEAAIAFLTPYHEQLLHGDIRLFLVFLGILAFRRFLIDTCNYRVIPTADVRKGMILSLQTTMLMQKSRVKGLPRLSAEDMRSRLTEEEAESVRRWEHSHYGCKEITIVRCFPFGLFIAVGTVLFMIGGIVWRG